jgi:molybdenum cofactor biosynthesis enzyme MoaA
MGKELRITPPVDYCLEPKPIDVTMALTNTCNHRCIFCQYHKVVPKAEHMNLDKGLEFLRQAHNLGIKEAGFALIDEPFMSKDLEHFVLGAKNIGFEYVFFNTNGALADKKRVEELYKNGLDSIKFSINAGKKETYKIVHGKNDFDKVIKNVKDASELRSKINSDIKIFVSFAESNSNKGEGEILEGLLKDYVDKVYIVRAINQGGGMYEESQTGTVSKDETLWGRYKNPDGGNSIISGKICPYPFKRVSITAEGYLTACCVDAKNELVAADLNMVSLEEAWNNNIMKKLRSWHINDEIPENCKCYNCIKNCNNDVLGLDKLI